MEQSEDKVNIISTCCNEVWHRKLNAKEQRWFQRQTLKLQNPSQSGWKVSSLSNSLNTFNFSGNTGLHVTVSQFGCLSTAHFTDSTILFRRAVMCSEDGCSSCAITCQWHAVLISNLWQAKLSPDIAKCPLGRENVKSHPAESYVRIYTFCFPV